MHIKLLNSATIDQIAAGEVVVRPASVVKELVENAIDAQATNIQVAVEEGGRKLISISDNGIGIPYNEVPLAFKRHATSKLVSIDDLNDIATLGFRGEALSSIAAVAKVLIKTRFHEEEAGSETYFSDGKMQFHRPFGRNIGTTITVSDLFYNIPARFKHMGKAQTEAGHVADIMEKMALSHPEIAITYVHNHKRQFATLGDGRLQGVIESIFGRKFFNALIPIKYENAPLTIKGYIGGLNAMRHTKDFQIFFMNRRYIKNAVLTKAFEEAYAGYVMQHCHPSGILLIECPQKMLDVNIHPAKTEIGILNQSLFSLLFKQGIRETLRNSDLSIKSENMISEQLQSSEPSMPAQTDAESVNLKPVISDQLSIIQNDHSDLLISQTPLKPDVDHQEKNVEKRSESDNQPQNRNPINQVAEQPILYSTPSETKQNLPQLNLKNAKIIGQLFSTYILLEQGNEAIMIDQHAAHEAFMYHELKDRLEQKTGFPSQLLLPEQKLNVAPNVISSFENIRSKCTYYGYDCDIYDESSLIVRSVPIVLGQPLNVETLYDYIELLNHPDGDFDRSVELQKIITMSCKAAVKGNQYLSHEEIRGLLNRLEQIDNPFTCPHGRPIIYRIKKYDLEKMFKRVI